MNKTMYEVIRKLEEKLIQYANGSERISVLAIKSLWYLSNLLLSRITDEFYQLYSVDDQECPLTPEGIWNIFKNMDVFPYDEYLDIVSNMEIYSGKHWSMSSFLNGFDSTVIQEYSEREDLIEYALAKAKFWCDFDTERPLDEYSLIGWKNCVVQMLKDAGFTKEFSEHFVNLLLERKRNQFFYSSKEQSMSELIIPRCERVMIDNTSEINTATLWEWFREFYEDKTSGMAEQAYKQFCYSFKTDCSMEQFLALNEKSDLLPLFCMFQEDGEFRECYGGSGLLVSRSIGYLLTHENELLKNECLSEVIGTFYSELRTYLTNRGGLFPFFSEMHEENKFLGIYGLDGISGTCYLSGELFISFGFIYDSFSTVYYGNYLVSAEEMSSTHIHGMCPSPMGIFLLQEADRIYEEILKKGK